MKAMKIRAPVYNRRSNKKMRLPSVATPTGAPESSAPQTSKRRPPKNPPPRLNGFRSGTRDIREATGRVQAAQFEIAADDVVDGL